MITRTNNIEVYGLVEFGREMKVRFSSKPGDAILGALKSMGFKFSPYNGWTKDVQSKDEAVDLGKKISALGCAFWTSEKDKVENRGWTGRVAEKLDVRMYTLNEGKAYIIADSIDELIAELDRMWKAIH